MTIATWQEKAAVKRAEMTAKIPQEWLLPTEFLKEATGDANVLDIPARCGILTQSEIQITEIQDATTLRNKLAAQELSAVEVATAFCKRAAIAQQLTFCLTETMFPEALERAKMLDEHLKTTGKPYGPLHGVPISIKDSLNVEGVYSTLGIVSFLDHPTASQNSPLVDVLLDAGAILYVKTNIPQTMMTADSHNNVFGRVLNPHRLNLTAGGSSGGEGALIAMRGSILGIGTDIAGSIRIPALCCGTFGFKPSVGRVPSTGKSAGRPGMTGIAPVAGPLCHSVRDAEMLLQVVFDADIDDKDDSALAFPWIEPINSTGKVLAIGILPEDPRRPLHPSMQRTLATATEKLQQAGHTTIDLTGVDFIADASDLSFSFFRADPDQIVLKRLSESGEPAIPSLKFTYDLEGKSAETTLRDFFNLNAAKAEISSHMRRAFIDNKLDFIIAPGYQSPAVPHDTYGIPIYTVLANLVDYPACVIPFGKAEATSDSKFIRDVEYYPPCKDIENVNSFPGYLLIETDQPSQIEGAPCHVQLIGRRQKDEILIKHAKIVENILKS